MFVRARCPAASSPLACASMDAAPEAHSHTNTRSTEGTIQRHHDAGYPVSNSSWRSAAGASHTHTHYRGYSLYLRNLRAVR